ncbi:DUF262 domain-containing protein [Vreelandella alkaliphila]
MNLNVGQISLIDLVGQLERKEVVVNKNYQRGAGLWPDSARSYFIDTILEGYPFPKIYLYQVFNEKAKRPIKEIVDGQQRITTIIDFMNNKFKLNSASRQYAGMYYSDLDEDVQNSFISYQIETSIILSATRAELLEMFRRINAYTAPLTAAEKRHATYQGAFKWFIVEQADEYAPILDELEIFTAKQLARMQDSEFIADLVVVLVKGVIQKSAKTIDDIYKVNDEGFESSEKYSKVLSDFFNFLSGDLEPLHNTFMMKSYVIHSLFSAYAHCKYGIPGGEEISGVRPKENISINLGKVLPILEALASAHEEQDESGPYKDYVRACISSTTKTPQRTQRFKTLCKVLVS